MGIKLRNIFRRRLPKRINRDSFRHDDRGAVLLVYGQCDRCGWHCACFEGAMWPKCPFCKTQVLPARERSERRGFIAFPRPEQEAVSGIAHVAVCTIKYPPDTQSSGQ